MPGAVMARYDGEDEHDVKVRDGCVLGAALPPAAPRPREGTGGT